MKQLFAEIMSTETTQNFFVFVLINLTLKLWSLRICTLQTVIARCILLAFKTDNYK